MTKTKIKIKEIADNDTIVSINCPEHRIDEIKQEIKNCFQDSSNCAPVLEMWENDK